MLHYDTMFSILLFTFVVIFFVYNLISRRLEQNAQYFRAKNLEYKGFSFGLKAFLSMFFGRMDVFEFTQRNYNAVPTEPYVLETYTQGNCFISKHIKKF